MIDCFLLMFLFIRLTCWLLCSWFSLSLNFVVVWLGQHKWNLRCESVAHCRGSKKTNKKQFGKRTNLPKNIKTLWSTYGKPNSQRGLPQWSNEVFQVFQQPNFAKWLLGPLKCEASKELLEKKSLTRWTSLGITKSWAMLRGFDGNCSIHFVPLHSSGFL